MKLIEEIKQDKREIDYEFKRCYNKKKKLMYWSDYDYLYERIIETISKIKKVKGFKNKVVATKIKWDLQSLFIKLDDINKVQVILEGEDQ